ncbi:lysophospholipase [Dehalogenimonas sp. THU2]|uniref:alpha/beta hydrolase n=1 Tax=Dehalogenimonas sp. THU2 TaxID=3151121 RepID=UPI0032185A3A
MSHIEGTFTIGRKAELFYQAWLPDNPPKAVIVLVHGLADHSSRYGNVVDHLLPKGFAVWSYDQRGHGRSPGTRCYINRFTDLTGDLDKFIGLVRQQNPGLPLFLIGHSMGALESAAVVAGHSHGVAGLVLSGLVLKTGKSISKMMVSMAGVLSTLVPRLGIQRLNCEAVSRDTSVVDGYVKDPLVFRGKIPARMGAEVIAAMSLVEAKLPSIKLPVLLLHGALDRLAEPSSSQTMYDGIASTDKKLHIFPGCYHEIFNEPCRDYVLGITSDWLNKHTPA